MSLDDLIPENEEGIQTNTESEAVFDSEAAAVNFFELAKQRLLNINSWQEYAGAASAAFQLADATGKAIDRAPRAGDYFRINIPAPGPQAGNGNDWVKVEEVYGDENSMAIKVRPSASPESSSNDVAHFFADSATSSFIIRRSGNKVLAGVYGRNEKPNTSVDKLTDKVRNAAIATGAIGGFSKLQWKSLVNGWIRQND